MSNLEASGKMAMLNPKSGSWDELLNGEILDTPMEAKVLIESWRQQYNRFRPRSSLAYKPPAPETKWLEKLNQGVVHCPGAGQIVYDYHGNSHDICVIDADGKDQWFLTNDEYNDMMPDWKP